MILALPLLSSGILKLIHNIYICLKKIISKYSLEKG